MKKFFEQGIFQNKGVPLWKKSKNMVHVEHITGLWHIDVARRSDKGSTYVGRGRGRGHIGSPISYKIKLKSVFASKK